MKKFAAIAAIMFSSTMIASAQETPATAPSATMPSHMMTAQMAPRGLIESYDMETKTFKLSGVGQTTVVNFTDETVFFLSKPEEQAELTDGAKVLITGRVTPNQTSVRPMNVGVLQIAEGEQAPEDEISFGRVVGTLKVDGDIMSVVIATDDGEKVLAMDPVQRERVMAVKKVSAEEALQQKESLAMLKGERTETGFNATSVQVVPLRRPATAPAVAPETAPETAKEAAPAPEEQ